MVCSSFRFEEYGFLQVLFVFARVVIPALAQHAGSTNSAVYSSIIKLHRASIVTTARSVLGQDALASEEDTCLVLAV